MRLWSSRGTVRIVLAAVAVLAVRPTVPVAAQQPGEIDYRDEPVLPGGVLGARIESLIDVFNANDADRVQQFLEEECAPAFRDFAPLQEHLNVFASIRRQWGRIEFHSIRLYTPPRTDQTVVILKDRNFETWRAFVLRFEGSDSLVAGLQFSDARTPTDVQEPPLTEQGLIASTAVLMRRICESDIFSGTLLLAKDDEVLLTHACGEASKRFHVANDIDTRFNLGSMNKMFTATAIMQLVEQGLISLQDSISRYVDETWLPRAITNRVTIHHLITHTSGLGSYFNDMFWNSSRALYREVDDYKPLIRGEELAFEPGAEFRYSNTGLFLLGVVIERATGERYFDYIREHIYEPAGMRHSDSYEMDLPVENLAMGYLPDPSSAYGWRNNLYQHVIKGGPAGGGFSTVGDLYRFARALVTGRLVSPESLERMWTDHSGEGYGYGFGVEHGPAGKVVGHGGGFPGINANLDIFVDRGYVVAVMSNYSRAASPVAREIARYIGRVEPERM